LDGRLGARGSKATRPLAVKKLGGTLESRQVQIRQFLGGAARRGSLSLRAMLMDGRTRRSSTTVNVVIHN